MERTRKEAENCLLNILFQYLPGGLKEQNESLSQETNCMFL
jgi:hypothetical protein